MPSPPCWPGFPCAAKAGNWCCASKIWIPSAAPGKRRRCSGKTWPGWAWTGTGYWHIPLLLAPDGRRLSKREGDLDLGRLRQQAGPEQIIGWLAWAAGLLTQAEALSPRELLPGFSWKKIRRDDIVIPERFPWQA